MDRFILSPGIASSGGTARIIAAIGVNIFFARGKLKYIVIEKKNWLLEYTEILSA